MEIATHESSLLALFIWRIFIEHKWRSKLLMKRLFDAAEDEARAMGLTKLLAFGVTEEITDYVQRLGYEKQPWSVLVKELI